MAFILFSIQTASVGASKWLFFLVLGQLFASTMRHSTRYGLMYLSFDGLRYAQIVPAFNEPVVPRFWGRSYRFALKDDGSVGRKDVSRENSSDDVDIVAEDDCFRIETL